MNTYNGVPSHCLFCREEHLLGESIEHLIPKKMGGWLKTPHLCTSCNGTFGSQVDRLVNFELFAALRREVGLRVPRRQRVKFIDRRLRITDEAFLGEDGELELVSPVFESQDGKRFIIRGESQEEVERIASKRADRFRREGIEVTTGPIEPGDPQVVRMHVPPQDIDELRTLLRREAAKIAVEYVALRASPEIALMSALDSVREFARTGHGFSGVRDAYIGPTPFVRLPRLNQLQAYGSRKPPNEERFGGYLDSRVPIPDNDELPDLSGFPEWPGFEHRLELIRDNEGGRFQLTLFTAHVVTVELPSSLVQLLPWRCFDSKDMKSRSSPARQFSPWSSLPPLLRS